MIRYPSQYDDDDNLYLVHDGLKLKLAVDYVPGDKTITIYPEEDIMARFPDKGTITLTDQCNDFKDRAITFYYSAKDKNSFRNIELLFDQNDCHKPKDLTIVTQNVMAIHRNALKDAIISIEKFLGSTGQNDKTPFGSTLVGRLNFLRKIILSPKAWIGASDTIGLSPFTVTFESQSYSSGKEGGLVVYEWDFGDGDSMIVYDSTIVKTYEKAGKFDVSLKITNDWGSDIVIFPQMITVKKEAPEAAKVIIESKEDQILKYPLQIRTSVNNSIKINIQQGIDAKREYISHAGEYLDKEYNPIDPITSYTWGLIDDLNHNTSNTTEASYSVGGLYDLVVRTDTRSGSFRITNFPNAIDVVERTNLWLWTHNAKNAVQTYEMGLISESFKVKTNKSLELNRDESFLHNEPYSNQQINVFYRNCGFAKRGKFSGDNGETLLYWASGRKQFENTSKEQIYLSSYNGFTDTYNTCDSIQRPWNWTSFASDIEVYIFLGGISDDMPIGESFTNPNKIKLNLSKLNLRNEVMTYTNGAEELMRNPTTFLLDGFPEYGHYSVYKTAWKDHTGYMLRNDCFGKYYTLKRFYKTEGTLSNFFMQMRKMADMPGSPRIEGELASLARGVFFFNNSASINIYNDYTNVWETASSALSVATFRSALDRSVNNCDKETNSLLVATDGAYKAYLSFDYSDNAFVKFSQADMSFTNIGPRPHGEQWQCGIF